ncbi:MAG: hypothetical protein MHPSP_003621, partial [Paramarteilia canceri]
TDSTDFFQVDLQSQQMILKQSKKFFSNGEVKQEKSLVLDLKDIQTIQINSSVDIHEEVSRKIEDFKKNKKSF